MNNSTISYNFTIDNIINYDIYVSGTFTSLGYNLIGRIGFGSTDLSNTGFGVTGDSVVCTERSHRCGADFGGAIAPKQRSSRNSP